MTEEKFKNESIIKPIDEATDEQLLSGIKLSYVLSKLKEYIEYMEMAQHIYESLPKYVQESLDECKDFPPMILAQLLPELRIEWLSLQREVHTILETMAGSSRPWLGGSDKEILISIIRLLPKLQNRSKRQLRQFLEASLEGDLGYLFIKNKGTRIEIRHRHKVDDSIMNEFDVPTEW